MRADKRLDIDDYFMKIAEDVSLRSTCLRRDVGAVIVKDRHILATGYNGAPSGCAHCTEETCIRTRDNIPSGEHHELCRGTHAEQNAIVQAAKYGMGIDGTTIYCTLQPCVTCAKLIINAGIKRVVYKGHYIETLGLELLREAGIELVEYKDNHDYPNESSEEFEDAPTLREVLNTLATKNKKLHITVLKEEGEEEHIDTIFIAVDELNVPQLLDKKVFEFDADLNSLRITVLE